MMSLQTVAAQECNGGCKQACVGFWHWPSNHKKHFGVYKSRLSCAQRAGVLGREEGGDDAPGHMLGSEKQAAIPATAGTACTPAVPHAPPSSMLTGILKMAKPFIGVC